MKDIRTYGKLTDEHVERWEKSEKRAEEAEAERDRLKPIIEDLARMLPKMPVVLFHYNPAVPWKALATRAVEVLANQEPKSSGDHN